MKKKYLALIPVVLVSVLIAFFATIQVTRENYTPTATSKPGETIKPEYIEVTDVLNRLVRVQKYPSKIVAIGPGALRLVIYLDALNLLAGVEEVEVTWNPLGRDYAMAYGDYLKKLPIIGPGGPRSTPDPEKIRSVKPDLVIMSSIYAQLYDPDRLSREVNAPVIVVDYGEAGYLDVNGVKSALILLGKVLNREERARELCTYIDSIVDDLANRTRNIANKPSVYVGAVSYKGSQPFTSSQVRFPPLVLLNTSSIVDNASSKAGFISVDFEYILSAQPLYIFIDLNNLNVVLDEFNKDKAKFCALTAFKEQRIYSILPFNYYYTNVATALADAYYMGKVLYPDQFIDVDPIRKADEIFKVFLGKELYHLFLEGYRVGFDNLSNMFTCSTGV
ncbi:MAG: ABC transporter substrate-binding protein [Desulfurococcaceae archaeon]